MDEHTIKQAEAAVDRAQGKAAEASGVAPAPVQMVRDDERLVHISGASRFFYRRLPNKIRNRFIQKCTKRGDLKWGDFMDLCMRWCIIGWENVVDAGAVVPFDPDTIENLPPDLQLELQDLMGAAAPEESERLKNF